MPSLMQKLQAKLELFRLEQRYTRNRHRRSTFVSNAVYVDGEYVYQTPNSTGSSNTSNQGYDSDRRHSVEEPRHPVQQQQQEEMTPAQRKRMHRFSSMPGFGTSTKATSHVDFRSTPPHIHEVR